MNTAEAQSIAAKLETASEILKHGRITMGMYPREDEAMWMKDIILSRCHDAECLINEIREIYAGA